MRWDRIFAGTARGSGRAPPPAVRQTSQPLINRGGAGCRLTSDPKLDHIENHSDYNKYEDCPLYEFEPIRMSDGFIATLAKPGDNLVAVVLTKLA